MQYQFNEYSEVTPKLKRNLQTGMIFVQGNWGSIFYNNVEFKIYGFYIHHPSEHTVTLQLYLTIQFGEEYLKSDMEVQLLLFSSASTEILLVSLLYDILPNTKTHENKFLKSLNLPKVVNQKDFTQADYKQDDLKLSDVSFTII